MTDKDKKIKKKLKTLEKSTDEFELDTEKALPSKEMQRYKTYVSLYKSTKRLTKKLRQQAEEGDKVNTRDIYALCALMTSLREIMNDIRQLDDASDNAKQLTDNVFDPFVSFVGQKVLDVFYAQQRSVLEYAPPKAAKKIVSELKEHIKSAARDIEAERSVATEKIDQIFQGSQ